MEKIRQIETISRTVRVDNGNDTEAQYAITAKADIENGELKGVNEGKVTDSEGTELATFGFHGDERMSVSMWRKPEQRGAIMSAIEAFHASLKACSWQEGKEEEEANANTTES